MNSTKGRFNRYIYIAIIILIFGGFAIFADAAFNEQINFQGKLTDSNNLAVENGNYNFEFSLYATDTAGTATWTETATGTNQIAVTDGLFSHLLGSITSLSSVDFNQTLWLEVKVGATSTVPSWETMTPRKKLGAVPAAFEAKQLGGYGTSSFAILSLPATITGQWAFNNVLSATASSSSAILTVNQTGSGNLVDLQIATTSKFVINNSGAIATGTWNATPIGAQYGGTGTSTASWTGVPYIAAGVWSTTTALASAITSLNGLTTSTQTFATSNDTNIGLNITSSGSVHTFSPQWIGTLANARIASSTYWSDAALTVYSSSTNWDLAFGWGNHAIQNYATTGVTTLSSLTSIGTIATGTWQATPIGAQYGGTGTSTANWTGVPYIATGVWGTTTTGGANYYGPTVIVAAANSTNTARASYICDGTNDEAEINQAIQSIYSTGGTIQLLEGTYNISTSSGSYLYGIQIATSNIALIGSGQGTVLKRAANFSAGIITVGDAGTSTVEGITISDLQIDGVDGTFTTGYGIWLYQKVHRSQIRNNWLHDNKSTAIYINGEDGTGNYYIIVEGNQIINNGYRGIALRQATRNTISNNVIYNNTGAGIDLNFNSNYNNISSNIISNNGSDGIDSYGPVDYNTISSNIISNNTGDGIHFEDADYNIISGNTISSNSDEIELGGTAFRLVDNNVIASNNIYSSTGNCINISGGSNTNNNYIVANEISGGCTKINDAGAGTTIQQRDWFDIVSSATGTSLTITVATSTHNPQIVFRTSTSTITRFIVGVDQSDSNKFKIATSTLGTNDLFTIDYNTGNLTMGAISTGTWQAMPIGSAYGGTGTSTSAWTGIPYITGGVWGTTTDLSSAITSLNGLTTSTQTFATSNDTNIGLNITSSGSVHTFSPQWIGTLANARIASSTYWSDAALTVYSSSTNWDLAFGWGNHATQGYLDNSNLYWVASGTALYSSSTFANIGIGTTTPAYTLDAYGTFRALSTSTFSGRVGIGTSTPARTLEVLDASNPQMRITQAASKYAEFEVESDGDLNVTLAASNNNLVLSTYNLYVCAGGCPSFTLSNGGNLVVENESYFAGDKIQYPSSLGQPKRSIILTSAGAITPTSLGASQTKVDGTNSTYYVLDYADATTSFAFWEWIMPDSFASSTNATSSIDVTIYWTATTTGNVIWGLQTIGVSNNENIDQALGSTATSTSAAQATSTYIASVTFSNYIVDWMPQDYISFNVYREGGSGVDTLTASARLVKVKIEYAVKQESD